MIIFAAASAAVFKLWQWGSIPADAPIIGVSYDTAWHAQVGLTTKNYEVAITRAGGRILEIRPDEQGANEILDRIDALVLTGGGDVDPELYSGEDEEAQLVDRGRDELEIALIRGALERDLPILGICRGIQILNVERGGTLRSLREDAILSEVHGIGLGSMDAHAVHVEAGSKIERILGARTMRVNSFHGQAVGRLGVGLSAVARSPDGVIEAVESPRYTFVVATQWHPEIPPAQMPMFEELLRHARKYRANKLSKPPNR